MISEATDEIFSDDEDDYSSSNNTSILSETHDGTETRFSGGTQLDREFMNDPALNRSFRTAGASSQNAQQLLDTVATGGPLRPVTRQLPTNLPFWMTYELYRISLHLSCDVSLVFRRICKACETEAPLFSRFWKEVVAICLADKNPIPIKSAIKNWTHEDNLYLHPATARSVSLSARLDFSKTPEKHLFELKLNPLENDKSFRFQRKFGADRFLVLDIPCFAPEYPKYIPEKLRTSFKPEEIHERIFDWLGTKDLYIAGRMWRAFYVEPKDVPKKRRKDEGQRLKVHLFAVNGFDFASLRASSQDTRHRPISLTELIQWHIPILPNSGSTDLKLFARMHLGLSRTTPTVTLLPKEFIPVRDKKPQTPDGQEIENGEIMTDGCARMSYPLAQVVWKQIGNPTENVPSAFQARIAGAKGLWVVDYENSYPEISSRGFWIEVSDSQLKIKPHPAERAEADEFQRTFEVVKTSHRCSPANLNPQLITILENHMIPRNVLGELMLAELSEYYDSLSSAMDGPTELRLWLQKWHPTRSAKQELGWCGELPDAKEDELAMLLEAGFHPQDCNYLVTECLKRIITQYLEDRNEKLWIRVPYASNMFCVPDHLGVLEPGEIQVNFSEPVSDFPDWELEGRKVLVSRNPALLASDMQEVKFVYRPELRHRKDVAIFSTKGDYPLAGMLSGGDYDGDTVTVIWAEGLTKPFQNTTLPVLPTKKQCGIVSKTRYIQDLFTVSAPTVQEVNDFVRKCCAFNGVASRLGEVTKLYEKLIYKNSTNMSTPEALKLAALAGYLVDSPKAGDSFRTRAWRDLYNSIWNRFQLFTLPKTLAYDDEDATTSARKDKRTGMCLNILDYLKFDVAVGRSFQILENFDKEFNPALGRDIDLKKPCDDAWDLANRAKGAGREALKSVLLDLKTRVSGINQEWAQRISENDNMKARRDIPRDKQPLDYAKMVSELADKVADIEPLDVDCYIYHDFIRSGGAKGSNWAILRASCVYSEHHRSKMPWKLVGEELCFIKANALRARGQRVRPVVGYVRDYMKMDLKKQKRLVAAAELEDDGDDAQTVAGSEAV